MKYLNLFIALMLINASPLFSQQKADAASNSKPESKTILVCNAGRREKQNTGFCYLSKNSGRSYGNMNRLYYEGK